MFFKTLFFISVCFLSSLISDSIDVSELFSPAPDWAQPIEYNLDDLESKPELEVLLHDVQIHAEEHICYSHKLRHVSNRKSIEKLSRIDIAYEPVYDQVALHSVRVFRQGQWLDYSNQIIHRALQYQDMNYHHLLFGYETHVLFLNDIRQGDLIEYSYSVRDTHPILEKMFCLFYPLEFNYPIDRFSFRLLKDPSRPISYRVVPEEIEPTVTTLSSNLEEWHWSLSDLKSTEHERLTPDWYLQDPRLEISEYQTWQEVSRVLLELYQWPHPLSTPPTIEIRERIDQWMSDSALPVDRALLALRFVQDEIRYLGLLDQGNGHSPSAPICTFQRRFGDCKEKSFLLQYLLHLMDIPSDVVIIHTEKGKQLIDQLPSLFGMNHAILRINLSDGPIFVDPVYSLQGGSLKSTYLPHYEYGLVISEEEGNLVNIPLYQMDQSCEIEQIFELSSDDKVIIHLTGSWYGPFADRYRESLASKGTTAFLEKRGEILKRIYPEAKVSEPFAIQDDREANRFEMSGSFEIPLKKASLKIKSFAQHLFLDKPYPDDREEPYSINPNVWVKESIKIEHPNKLLGQSQSSNQFEDSSLFYSHTQNIDQDRTEITIELKHLDDHVPSESLEKYTKITRSIANHFPIYLDFIEESKQED